VISTIEPLKIFGAIQWPEGGLKYHNLANLGIFADTAKS
jgi:hypothetical protein